ncbi:MAG: glutathione peroxidase [Pseudomonadales bacterium]|nr:glutathione peroxidase [Pseudomonadales bacterium]
MPNLYDFELSSIDDKPLPLNQFSGKAVLLVNVASRCGLTPQYTGLEALYQEYKDQGLEIIALPCNQFLQQEPGTHEEIKEFCSLNYPISFPMSGKVDVNGENRIPLYEWLAGDASAHSGDITWNFEKFLVGRDGQLLKRFHPKIEPQDAEIKIAIEDALES